MRSANPSPPLRAFTLIELLVTVAVMCLVAALLLTAVQAARETSRRVQCVHNLKQIGLALYLHHENLGVFPPGYSLENPQHDGFRPGWGWGFFVLPGLEQPGLYNAANLMLRMTDPQQHTVISTRLSAFLCPSSADNGAVSTGYLGFTVAGAEGLAPGQYVASGGHLDLRKWYRARSAKPDIREVGIGTGVFFVESRLGTRDILDGTSMTILVGERSRNVADSTWAGVPGFILPTCTQQAWQVHTCDSGMFLVLGRTGPSSDIIQGTLPGQGALNAKAAGADTFWSLHPGGGNFLFGDGSVRFIRETVNSAVFQARATRAGGDFISSERFRERRGQRGPALGTWLISTPQSGGDEVQARRIHRRRTDIWYPGVVAKEVRGHRS